MDEREQVDGAIEQRGLEIALEVDVRARLGALDVAGNVDEGDDVDGELAEDGADEVDVENVGQGPLLRKSFDGLEISY